MPRDNFLAKIDVTKDDIMLDLVFRQSTVGLGLAAVMWPGGYGGQFPPTFAKMVLEIFLKSIRK